MESADRPVPQSLAARDSQAARPGRGSYGSGWLARSSAPWLNTTAAYSMCTVAASGRNSGSRASGGRSTTGRAPARRCAADYGNHPPEHNARCQREMPTRLAVDDRGRTSTRRGRGRPRADGVGAATVIATGRSWPPAHALRRSRRTHGDSAGAARHPAAHGPSHVTVCTHSARPPSLSGARAGHCGGGCVRDGASANRACRQAGIAAGSSARSRERARRHAGGERKSTAVM